MDLDELKLAWQALETRVETLEAQRVAGKVSRLGGPTAWELAFDIVGLFLTGSFLYHFGNDWRYLLPGLLLHIVAVLEVVTGVRQLVLLSKLDIAGSVLATQRVLLALHAERLRVNRALLMFAPLLWPPLLIVVLRALGGDPYKSLPSNWLWGNVIFGIVMVPIGLWIANRLGDRLGNEKIREALRDLDDLKKFELE